MWRNRINDERNKVNHPSNSSDSKKFIYIGKPEFKMKEKTQSSNTNSEDDSTYRIPYSEFNYGFPSIEGTRYTPWSDHFNPNFPGFASETTEFRNDKKYLPFYGLDGFPNFGKDFEWTEFNMSMYNCPDVYQYDQTYDHNLLRDSNHHGELEYQYDHNLLRDSNHYGELEYQYDNNLLRNSNHHGELEYQYDSNLLRDSNHHGDLEYQYDPNLLRDSNHHGELEYQYDPNVWGESNHLREPEYQYDQTYDPNLLGVSNHPKKLEFITKGSEEQPQNLQHDDLLEELERKMNEEKMVILESQRNREQQRRDSNLIYINLLREIVPGCERCTVEKVLQRTKQHIIDLKKTILEELQDHHIKLETIRKRIYRQ